MRKALCVGIDYYQRFGSLSYCVSDARSVLEALERHADDSKNFDVEKMYAETMKLTVPMGIDPDTGAKIEQEEIIGLSAVTTKALKGEVEKLFETDKNLDVVLFYFAGHGYFDEKGGYLCTSDSERPTDGSSFWTAATAAMRVSLTEWAITARCQTIPSSWLPAPSGARLLTAASPL